VKTGSECARLPFTSHFLLYTSNLHASLHPLPHPPHTEDGLLGDSKHLQEEQEEAEINSCNAVQNPSLRQLSMLNS
jgi:hypothetical protein